MPRPSKDMFENEMSSDPAARQAPLYQLVVKALRAEIIRGVHPIGAALPTEATLVERFGVSRHTVREALRNLRDLGLVESRQGFGTVVIRPGGPQVYVHQVDSIADLHDYRVASRYAGEAEALRLDEVMAERLDRKAGEHWLKIDGARFDDVSLEPICAVEIFVSARFAGVARLLGRHSGPIYSLIEAIYGESIDDVSQEVRAVPCPARIAPILTVQPDDVVIEIRRKYRLSDGAVAEITFNYYKADRFSLSMNLRRVR